MCVLPGVQNLPHASLHILPPLTLADATTSGPGMIIYTVAGADDVGLYTVLRGSLPSAIWVHASCMSLSSLGADRHRSGISSRLVDMQNQANRTRRTCVHDRCIRKCTIERKKKLQIAAGQRD